MDSRSPPRALFLEDFAVGRKFVTAELLVEEEEIKAFASRFDPQPFHLDADAARQSLFDGIAASGWLTAALSMRLIVDGEMKISGGIVGLGGEINWPRPTRPGDILRVESEVIDVKPSRSKPEPRRRHCLQHHTQPGTAARTGGHDEIAGAKETPVAHGFQPRHRRSSAGSRKQLKVSIGCHNHG